MAIGYGLSVLRMMRTECVLAFRARVEILQPIAFFILVVMLLSFATDGSPSTQQHLFPGLFWLIVLLAQLTTVDRLFVEDARDGTLEQYLLSPLPLTLVVLSKMIVHWGTVSLPLVFTALGVGALLGFSSTVLHVLGQTLLLGTPLLALISGLLSALTLSMRTPSWLLPLLGLPLYAPILIGGAGAVYLALSDSASAAPLAWLAVALMVGITLIPLAIAGLLRMSVAL